MTRDEIYTRLSHLSLSDFADIVEATKTVEGKLRILITDGSYIDVWFSLKKEGVYAYHWERRDINGTIYRHNNLPDKTAKKLKTFPKHFHNGTEKNIVESYISDDPIEAVKSFLEFVRNIINKPE